MAIESIANAQTDSTIIKRLDILEMRASYISANLIKCHNQFKTGSSLFFGGIVVSGLWLGLASNNNGRLYGSLAGSGVSLIGGIIMIASHRYIGKAGGLEINQNGIVFNISK